MEIKSTFNGKTRLPPPPTAKILTDKKAPNYEAWVWEDKKLGRVYIKGYRPKAVRCDFYYWYKKENKKVALDFVKKFFADAKKTIAEKAKRKAETTKPSTLKEGDILYSSWGWEQTNIDYYKVVKTIGTRTVMLVKLAAKITSDGAHYMSGSTVPILDKTDGEPFKKVVSCGSTVRLNSYSCAWPWDGRPLHCTWYA